MNVSHTNEGFDLGFCLQRIYMQIKLKQRRLHLDWLILQLEIAITEKSSPL